MKVVDFIEYSVCEDCLLVLPTTRTATISPTR